MSISKRPMKNDLGEWVWETLKIYLTPIQYTVSVEGEGKTKAALRKRIITWLNNPENTDEDIAYLALRALKALDQGLPMSYINKLTSEDGWGVEEI